MSTTSGVPSSWEAAIPRSRSFEPEFVGAPPRPVPDSLRRGPYAQRRRRTEIGLLAAGVGCLLASRIPGIDTLALYVLPLGYLWEIGWGLVVLAAVSAADRVLRLGPYRYVRDGMPLPARLVELAKAPSVITNGQPAQYAFTAAMALRHPETGEPLLVRAKSRDFAASSRERYQAPFQVGDEVTAVYLPGRFQRTVRLYAFLDLNPSIALQQRDAGRTSPWAVVGLLLAVPAIFITLLANLYALGRYHPIAFEYQRAAVPMALGGLLIGVPVLLGLVLSHRRDQRRTVERNLAVAATGQALEPLRPFLGSGIPGWLLRAAVTAGSLLLGVVTGVCVSFMANAWADVSAGRPVAARIRGATMTTHALLFREYRLEYSLAGSDEKLSLLTTPEQQSRFRTACAEATVRDGRLGWPWVVNLEPAPQSEACPPLLRKQSGS